jgi:SAM-dependent methyltransferase
VNDLPSGPGGRTAADEATRISYDTVASRYAKEIGGELAGKPLDRALLACLADLADGGLLADIGCGPGHITAYLADLGADVIGIDLSPGMIDVARERHPELAFEVGSLLALPLEDGQLAAAVCAYSIIHSDAGERRAAFAELARAIAAGGWLLVSFYVSMAEQAPGSVAHVQEWWGHEVDLEFHFLDPREVVRVMSAAGFTIMACTERQPWPDIEVASRRCYLLGRRNG